MPPAIALNFNIARIVVVTNLPFEVEPGVTFETLTRQLLELGDYVTECHECRPNGVPSALFKALPKTQDSVETLLDALSNNHSNAIRETLIEANDDRWFGSEEHEKKRLEFAQMLERIERDLSSLNEAIKYIDRSRKDFEFTERNRRRTSPDLAFTKLKNEPALWQKYRYSLTHLFRRFRSRSQYEEPAIVAVLGLARIFESFFAPLKFSATRWNKLDHLLDGWGNKEFGLSEMTKTDLDKWRFGTPDVRFAAAALQELGLDVLLFGEQSETQLMTTIGDTWNKHKRKIESFSFPI